MRADLTTIQQTLTPEAATVLNQAIAEAARRNHGQTTPLHVAATLLASPSGFLRQACIKSHPNSSHPLQCRALELCFSVALERLPTSATAAASPSQEPPVSNALMAALKRAQAHQRRGCPEQQQQPLLALKVELEQLIISILDDPSVSRVMREASFSSPAVKAAIEQSLISNSSSSGPTAPVNPSAIGFGFRTVPVPHPVNRNLYLNPRLQQRSAAQTGQQRAEEATRVVDILVRTRKRNPVLVGESEPQILAREILRKIENGEFSDRPLGNLKVISLEKELGSDNAQMSARVKEISGLVESQIGNSDLGGVILDLGDLKWLVEHQQQQTNGGGVVAEMRKLLERFGERLWLIGTATCETYLRCQVYYPSMENDWDLQAIPIAAKSPWSGTFCGLGSNNAMLFNSQKDSMSPTRSLQIPAAITVPVLASPRSFYESSDSGGRMTCCPLCMQNYRNDLASYLESKPVNARQSQLPQWLQNAKASDMDLKIMDDKLMKDQDVAVLQKKWNEACLRLHPSHHQHQPQIVPTSLSLGKLRTFRNPSENMLQLNYGSAGSPPASPVGTDLVLGRSNQALSTPKKTHEERVNGVPGHGFDIIMGEKLGDGDSFDINAFKKLLKGLAESVWWQHDAASAVAATVTQCKLGNRKTLGVSSRSDIWLLFTGPDRVGKRKMATGLSDFVSGADPITINPGSRRDDGHSDLSLRGKTVLNRIAEAVKRNPFAVIVIEDIDDADTLLRNNIKRAMGSGRICDSYGREISLGNVIFILTTNWSPGNSDSLSPINETNLISLVSKGWQLRLSVCDKTLKRGTNWLYDDEKERSTRQRKEILFDLNEAAGVDDDKANGSSTNSSDVTIDHDQEDNSGLINKLFSPPHANSSIHRELVSLAEDAIFFRPVDFGSIKQKTADSLKKRFSGVLENGSKLEIRDDALEKISGAILLSRISLEDWIEETMIPSLNNMKSRVIPTLCNEKSYLRLELDEDSSDRTTTRSYLPSSIRLVVD